MHRTARRDCPPRSRRHDGARPNVPHDGPLMTPTLVYLHGIGAEHDDAWRGVVSVALVDLGYPGLDGIDCRAPKSPNTLRYPSDERHVLPPQTTTQVARS